MNIFEVETLAREIENATEINDHNGAAVMLAEAFGHDREKTMLNQFMQKAAKRGCGDALEIMMRDYIVAQIIKRLDTEAARIMHAAF